MARIPGLVNCSVNFEVFKTAPLDARTVVDTVLELTQLDTWADESNKVWLYDGLVVAVKENNGLYVLSGQDENPLAYSDEANWHRIDAAAAKIDVVNNLTSTDSNKALAAAQGKVLSDKIEQLKSDLGSALTYKGSVDTFDDLPSNPSTGDTYNVVSANGNIPSGTNYAWNGEEWDPLGGSIDLSGYYTKTQVDEAIQTAQPTEELEKIKSDIKANTEALLIVNGTENTSGSLANTLKIAKDYTDTQLLTVVKKEEGKELISTDKLELIDTNAENIAELQTLVESNTSELTVLKGNASTTGSILNIVDTQITNALDWKEI